MKRVRLGLLLLVTALAAAACSRAIEVGTSDPGAAYAVSVTNATAVMLDVTYNDGDDHGLGVVGAGRTERFVVASPRTTDITISGRGQSRTSGPVRVRLSAGSTARVTLR
jgi:hypothetical protein